MDLVRVEMHLVLL